MKRILFFILLGTFSLGSFAQGNHNFETAKQLDIFNSLFCDLDLYYVDTLDTDHLIETAINSMLDELDPYTEYYKESDTDNLKTLTTGKYAGIGSPISWRKDCDRCVFENPYHGMPADKAGVRSGDIIMKIDGEDVGVCGSQAKNDYTTGITMKLRGEPGTTFTLSVKRPGYDDLVNMKITRETIKRPSVIYSTILDPAKTGGTKIGYILLESFIEDTSTEMKRAFNNLKSEGAERLILDLRGNGGGLMQQAVELVNMFVPKGKIVVETRGREEDDNKKYKTTTEPIDTEIPIAVLVDYGTASASEITSGSLQDYDRAVVIGQRTYGKGLVQSPRQLPYNTMMKFTSSKYYIPSGRCVQARDYKHRGTDGQPLHLPDSLCKTFKTAAGRLVKDGGGITPDIITKQDSLPTLISYLAVSDELFNYCVNYQNTHEKIAPAGEFHLTDSEFNDFKTYMAGTSFTYDNRAKKSLEVVRKIAQQEGYAESAKAELDALEAKLSRNLTDDLQLWEKEVRRVVESMIVSFYHYDKGLVQYSLQKDKDLNEAISVLTDTERYKQILNTK